MEPPVVEIILPTYNGEAFLAAQVDSILGQRERNWRLLLSDDGSTDGTRAIIARYVAHHPHRMRDVSPPRAFHDVTRHVEYLLGLTRSRYIMFCDQDDLWLPDKIERSLSALRALEDQAGDRGTMTPLLVHTDLRVVNARLQPITPSLWQAAKMPPAPTFGGLLFHNTVTGCATTVNRAAVECSLPFPSEAIMYDWWIALVVQGLGRMRALPGPGLLYRQHGSNLLGARALDGRSLAADVISGRAPEFYRLMRRRLLRTQRQTRAYLTRYEEALTPEVAAVAARYANLDRWGFYTRRRYALQDGYFDHWWVTKWMMTLFV